MRGQSLGANNQALHLLGAERVARLNPVVPDGLFALDNADRKAELMAKAAHESRILIPQLPEHLLSHVAAPYVPLY